MSSSLLIRARTIDNTVLVGRGGLQEPTRTLSCAAAYILRWELLYNQLQRARHRLDRVPFVGCPRSVVLARRQHIDTAQQPARHADMTAFFAHQAGPSSAPALPAA